MWKHHYRKRLLHYNTLHVGAIWFGSKNQNHLIQVRRRRVVSETVWMKSRVCSDGSGSFIYRCLITTREILQTYILRVVFLTSSSALRCPRLHHYSQLPAVVCVTSGPLQNRMKSSLHESGAPTAGGETQSARTAGCRGAEGEPGEEAETQATRGGKVKHAHTCCWSRGTAVTSERSEQQRRWQQHFTSRGD